MKREEAAASSNRYENDMLHFSRFNISSKIFAGRVKKVLDISKRLKFLYGKPNMISS